MQDWRPEAAARWLAEAVETGNPVGALPEAALPVDLDDAAAVAAAVVEELGQVACGVRLLLRADGQPPLAGPMIESRLLGQGRPVSLAALRRPLVSAAAVGVLAEALSEDGAGPPHLAVLHPALDVSDCRFAVDPRDDRLVVADLARLGLVVAGRAKTLAPQSLPVSLGAKGGRRRGTTCDLPAAFAAAAAAARRFGGLPAGAVLVVAGLTPAIAAPAGILSAAMGPLGRVEADFT